MNVDAKAHGIDPRLSSSASDTTVDLLVVGGGVIGLSCILHILDSSPDTRVVLLDAPTRPGVASRAAAGMLAPYAEFHKDSPLFRLCVESFEYYPGFLRRFCPDGPALDATGVLVPASGASSERAGRIATFASVYTDIRYLAPGELAAVEPALAAGRCREALHIPGAMVNPRKLHEALQSAVAARGVPMVDRSIAHVTLDDGSPGSVENVMLDDGTRIFPSAVLLASGAWSAALAAMFRIALDVTPVKGQVALIGAPEGFLRHIVHEHEIYLAPRRGEGIVIGATTEAVGFDPSVDGHVIADLKRRAAELAPRIEELPILDSWSGFRPRPVGDNPIIAWSDSVENVLLATGHFRNGILLAPITGRRIAALHQQGPQSRHLPSRNPMPGPK